MQVLHFKFKPVPVRILFKEQSIDMAIDDGDTMADILVAACAKFDIPSDTLSMYSLFWESRFDVCLRQSHPPMRLLMFGAVLALHANLILMCVCTWLIDTTALKAR
jgi:hypothetical protein